MEQPILEGTWEEIMLHAEELAGKRFRLIQLSDRDDNQAAKAIEPNERMLQALEKVAQRQKTRRETSAEGTQELLRRARKGDMDGIEPAESS